MIKSQEQDEFIAVRVQDPRVQNEGSWNSYVDFKIFLHTNSKAFTAKTSCVRRRYSEFVWLKKKLQKNAGLVPVPDLPKKSLFSFINDDFIERRRKGLQSFLDKVVHMTVCLSDSQLHLFLQTQLPVRHIEDCVQGHTPYTVTEAILNYASSNQGWAQEEEGGDQETGPAPVSYESVESPAPHLPSLQSPGATSSGAPNELSDVSDSESRLSDAEPTAPNLKLGTDHEQLPQEGESYVKLAVDVHPNLDDSVETEDKGLNTGSKNITNDLQKYDCDVAPQMNGLYEDTPLPSDKCSEDNLDQETISSEDLADNTSVDRVIENRVSGDFTEAKDKSQCVEQDNAVRQTLDEDYSRVRIENNEVTSDEEDTAEHYTEKELETAEDKALHDACEKTMADNEDKGKAAITEDHAVHQNGVSYEDSSEDVALQEEALNEKEEHVEEVKELKAKCFHPSNGILILDGIEEAVSTQTALMTETISNLDANAADVDTLVFEAIDIDSLQSQETDSHIIIATQQPNVC